MSIKAKLFFCSEERELRHTNIDYLRLVRWNGKPATQVMGGYITVTFPSEMYDDSFLETMLADRYENKRIEYPYNLYQLRDGKVVFYKDEVGGIALFEYNFKDATIIEYREEFDNQNGMYVTLTISPAIQDYRFFGNMTWEEKSPTRFVKTWEENYIPPKKETPYKSKESNIEKKKEIIEGIWLDVKETPLTTENGFTKKLSFGGKVKIKLIANDKTLNEEVQVTVKAKIGNKEQKLSDNGKPITFKVKMENGEGVSKPFLIDVDWYNEIDEEYDYKNYSTIIKPDKALTFTFETKFNGQTKEFPKKDTNKLVPVTYRRNYEELLGLLKIGEKGINGTKEIKDNYENKFIKKYSSDGFFEIEETVVNFINWLKENPNAKINDIERKVEHSAKMIWNCAILQNQGADDYTTYVKDKKSKKIIQKNTSINGKLDDRPLYWARIKMQVALKRHYTFLKEILALPQPEQDTFFKESIIPKNTKPYEIIQLFEEKSRNYTNIDFSKAGNKKKVLITGFDPFQLDSNPLQANPSGITALTLHNNDKLGVYIQTMMFPVRYTDFDGQTSPTKGNGTGVVEKYIGKVIDETPDIDAIITVSQKFEGDYHFEVFATNTRGGSSDNRNYTRIGEKAISRGIETLPTNLPDSFENNEAIFFGEYFETKEEYDEYDNYLKYKSIEEKKGEGFIEQFISDFENYDLSNHPKYSIYKEQYEKLKKYKKSYKNGLYKKHLKHMASSKNNYPKYEIYDAPGGNYLSNEIFYRVALLRKMKKSKLPTGHFHISKIQNNEDLDNDKVIDLLRTIKKVFKEGFKELKNTKR